MLTLDALRAGLAAHRPVVLPPPAESRWRTAVALVVAGPPEAPALCLIRKAERAGDPWSGQIALPGGRADPGEHDPRVIAVREAREEVGLDLAEAEALGALSDIQLRRHGLPLDGTCSPLAFYVGKREAALVPDPAEVSAAAWVPLQALWDPSRATMREWRDGDGETRRFPGIRLELGVLWGLTYRILGALAEACGATPLPGGASGPGRP